MFQKFTLENYIGLLSKFSLILGMLSAAQFKVQILQAANANMPHNWFSWIAPGSWSNKLPCDIFEYTVNSITLCFYKITKLLWITDICLHSIYCW